MGKGVPNNASNRSTIDQMPSTTVLETRSTVSAVSTSHQAEPTGSRPTPSEDLPRLQFEYRWWAVALYIIFLMFCNLLFPCLVFYLIRIYGKKITLRTNIGISSASLGLSSCFDAPFRLYKLVRFRQRYGPLNDDVFWHADFFMWAYTICLFTFAFPLAIAPALNPIALDFFLMSTTLLITPFGVLLLATLIPFRSGVPFWLSSDPPYTTPIKPGILYVTEDIGAVDFTLGRTYRTQIHARYASSPPFRRLMYILTWYFGIACLLFMGITAAVVWGAKGGDDKPRFGGSGSQEEDLNFRFGWVLGQVFLWVGAVGLGCWGL
ncbi:uncharacterized protein EI90DRAFT_3064518 [Cantharellus anzutake]|uniref:uncharacterized protein n=1 Tax=Cantharellus anzutake TaxID=1750568 RepID=UPI001908F9EF|nr:uncharacterized protein EI90DRAFT_3064518 [Cantharellus anzutake]KAF8328541.1 hypothetical protein EI90DRAFT_3064518 [Cantharellus anzutake]